MNIPTMTGTGPAIRETDANQGTGWRVRIILVMAIAIGLSGCINVNAPEDAIVIELNINIRQEVIYRLAEDASNTIEENADIF